MADAARAAVRDLRKAVATALDDEVPAELVRLALLRKKYRRDDDEHIAFAPGAEDQQRARRLAASSAPVVVVTGCCGRIGRGVANALIDADFRVRGFDRLPKPPAGLSTDVEYTRGILQQKKKVHKLVQGAYAVVHLAACPDDADFEAALLPANIVGLMNILQACEDAGVQRLVVASSGKLYAKPSTPYPIKPTDPVSVVCNYGASKLFAEGAAQSFASRTGVSTTVLRFAWCPRTPSDVAAMRAAGAEPGCGYHEFLSPADAGRCVLAALRTAPEFAILFCQSNPPPDGTWRFDIGETTRILGWTPQDSFPLDQPPGSTWVDELVQDDYTQDPDIYPRDDPTPNSEAALEAAPEAPPEAAPEAAAEAAPEAAPEATTPAHAPAPAPEAAPDVAPEAVAPMTE